MSFLHTRRLSGSVNNIEVRDLKEYILAEGFTAKDIPAEIADKIDGVTYHKNDSITIADLAYLEVLHIDFDGKSAKGELICNKKLAKEILHIFKDLYDKKYAIEKLRLADEYGGDDDRIMADNNSSCFNYRVIFGTKTISLHGLGRAIDINPLYNPYIVNGKIMPDNATPFADRDKDFPHKIDKNDVCFKVFKSYGWLWGGDWTDSKDYQHFYKEENGLKRIIQKIKDKL